MHITFITSSLQPPTYDQAYHRHHVGRVGLSFDPETQAIVGFEMIAYCDYKEIRKEIPVGVETEPNGVVDCASCMTTINAIKKVNQ